MAAMAWIVEEELCWWFWASTTGWYSPSLLGWSSTNGLNAGAVTKRNKTDVPLQRIWEVKQRDISLPKGIERFIDGDMPGQAQQGQRVKLLGIISAAKRNWIKLQWTWDNMRIPMKQDVWWLKTNQISPRVCEPWSKHTAVTSWLVAGKKVKKRKRMAKQRRMRWWTLGIESDMDEMVRHGGTYCHDVTRSFYLRGKSGRYFL